MTDKKKYTMEEYAEILSSVTAECLCILKKYGDIYIKNKHSVEVLNDDSPDEVFTDLINYEMHICMGLLMSHFERLKAIAFSVDGGELSLQTIFEEFMGRMQQSVRLKMEYNAKDKH